jgi:tetratricopeptide (TPR) repeat protein
MTPELRLDRAFGLFVFEHKLREAESELNALRCERPPLVHAYIRLALVYLASGRLEEARAALLDAQAADDLAPQVGMLATVVRLFRREFRAAEESARRDVELHPSSLMGRAFYAEALEGVGRVDEALGQYKLALALSPDALHVLADQGGCLARHGRVSEALAILEQLQRFRRSAYVDAYHVALLLGALGRRDEAFQELERAFGEMAYSLLFIDVDAKADSLRADPRFIPFRNRVYRCGSATAA